ncbi:MAG: Aminodeoxychorismate lyase, partial [Parcubacteria group bacterium GW2011_GWB1_41_5]
MNFFFANKVFFYTLVVIAFLVFLYVFPLSPPADFPAGIIFRVEHGSSLRSVSLKLKEENIIRSRLVFETFVILLGREKRVIEADYYFENKFPVYEVARRIGKGEHHLAPVVVTIPEGFDAVQIADAFVPKLVNFDKSKFLSEAAGLEGYLFPDTYFFQRTDTETDVIKSMRANFEKKMLSLKSDIALSGRTQREIIVMASLIEGEAKGEVDQALISGILWKRISIGMPLQV